MLQQTLLQEIFIPASTKWRSDVTLTASAICQSGCNHVTCKGLIEPALDLPVNFYA